MILQVEGVSKQFGGLQALQDVTFDLPEGQIMGLIGPNGAGKTTLFNCISGVYEPTAGRVIFRGDDITGIKPYYIAKKGMARTHQIVRPLEELTVLENVMVGACFGQQDYGLGEARKIAHEIMSFVGLSDRSDQLAGSLNVGQKKRLEMARALAAQPYLLLLDEVLAGLNPSEISQMVEIVKAIRNEREITIIMIEHVMHAVMNVSDRIVVLDYGRQLAEGTPQEIAENEKVIEAYLGDPKLAERLLSEGG
ncbi:MAG: ABC transporter ATP-binding protein [Candidatus Promineifilaceae bacterium]